MMELQRDLCLLNVSGQPSFCVFHRITLCRCPPATMLTMEMLNQRLPPSIVMAAAFASIYTYVRKKQKHKPRTVGREQYRTTSLGLLL